MVNKILLHVSQFFLQILYNYKKWLKLKLFKICVCQCLHKLSYLIDSVGKKWFEFRPNFHNSKLHIPLIIHNMQRLQESTTTILKTSTKYLFIFPTKISTQCEIYLHTLTLKVIYHVICYTIPSLKCFILSD